MVLFIFILAIIVIVFSFNKAKRLNDQIKNPDEWHNLVSKRKLSPEFQKELCKKHNITRPIIHEQFDCGDTPLTISTTYESTKDKNDPIQYKNLDSWKNDLTVIWAGDTKDIEFTYEKNNGNKSRRKIKPTELIYDGRKTLIIAGICEKSNEERHFKTGNITTMIKVGSWRGDTYDWALKYLNVDLFDIDDLSW